MWRGYKISTGPLDFGLDDSTGISCGVMNYELGVVSSEFHVLVRFRRFALQLKALGIDAELMAPIHAVLKTEGKILPDHSFNGGPPRQLQGRVTQDVLCSGSSNRDSAGALTTR